MKKKDLELLFCKHFLKTLGIIDKIDISESPDFLINYLGNRVGIEITTLYRKDRRQIKESCWSNILFQVQRIWEKEKNPNIETWIDFKDSYILKPNKVKILAKEIVGFIKTNLPDNKTFTRINRNIIKSKFYGKIDNIVISRLVDYKNSYFSNNDADFSQILTFDIISNAIESKNKKTIKYLEKCDSVWLVMIIDGARLSTNFEVPEDILEYEYESKFDEIFIFSYLRKKIFKLKRKY